MRKTEKNRCYSAAFKIGVMTIMVTHHVFLAVDDTILNGNEIPSTLSPKIIQGLLRKEMGFEGVVITNGINMAGLMSSCGTREEVLIRSINAGNNILLGVSPDDFDLVYNAVCNLYGPD